MNRLLVTIGFLLVATVCEAGGDAIVRIGLRPHVLAARAGLMAAGAAVLFAYGLTLNLAPLDWGRLMGAYVAMFFVVGQVINLVVFATAPTVPVMAGGALIVAGGLVATLWR